MAGQGSMVRYFDFGRYHGKPEPQGSTTIRMVQMEKHWPDFKPYKYGEFPDALIFQKVYCTEDYKFPAHFENIKILDICDPDWLDGIAIVETCAAMDAVVCPTEPLAEYLRQFHNNVVVIPDRFETEGIQPRTHTEEAKEVVWFGYAHNAVTMKPAMRIIDELGLKLRIIANDDPFLHQWSKRDYKDFYTFVKYNDETIYDELAKSDFAVFPAGDRPVDRFKSNNKTIKANLAGLPVAKTADEVKHYMSAANRRKWFDDNYVTIQAEYDIRKSVAEYKELINAISRH